VIDGIKTISVIGDFGEWKEATGLQFHAPMLDDGTMQGQAYTYGTTYTHSATWRNYELTVKETVYSNVSRPNRYLLFVTGSLHKAYYVGCNYQAFTYKQLSEEIGNLCKGLKLSPNEFRLQNCEVGLNIPMSVAPIDFIRDSLVTFKRNAFQDYDMGRNGLRIGSYCQLSQFVLKVYDKGLLYSLPYNLMRIELRYTRMLPLNRLGIHTLDDLKNPYFVSKLRALLLTAWKNVTVYDIKVKPETMPLIASKRRLLEQGRFGKYWEGLAQESTGKYADRLKVFKQLVQEFGEQRHRQIAETLASTWDTLQAENHRKLPVFPKVLKSKKSHDLTVKVKGKNIGFSETGVIFRVHKKGEAQELSYVQRKEETPPQAPPAREREPHANAERTCKSCGKDISRQKPRSLYCSAKYVGERAAHGCRNATSNPINNFLGKIARIERKGILFDVRPYFV